MIVKDSPIHGKGLFADRDYTPDEVIFYSRQTLSENVFYCFFVNHSCIPTCYVKFDSDNTEKRNHEYRAGKNGMKNGCEITIDYRIGRIYPEWKRDIEGRCTCEICNK